MRTLALLVDFAGDRLELVAHRIVRDGAQMHDRVDPVEQRGRKFADVAEHLPVQQRFGQNARPGQAVAEKSGVVADQLRVFEFSRRNRVRTGPT